jgi:hypothetical protein
VARVGVSAVPGVPRVPRVPGVPGVPGVPVPACAAAERHRNHAEGAYRESRDVEIHYLLILHQREPDGEGWRDSVQFHRRTPLQAAGLSNGPRSIAAPYTMAIIPNGMASGSATPRLPSAFTSASALMVYITRFKLTAGRP